MEKDSVGFSVMVSGYASENDGIITITQEQLDRVNEKRAAKNKDQLKYKMLATAYYFGKLRDGY